jgi:hypothetical protein
MEKREFNGATASSGRIEANPSTHASLALAINSL